jgi:hypothetical protein
VVPHTTGIWAKIFSLPGNFYLRAYRIGKSIYFIEVYFDLQTNIQRLVISMTFLLI